MPHLTIKQVFLTVLWSLLPAAGQAHGAPVQEEGRDARNSACGKTTCTSFRVALRRTALELLDRDGSGARFGNARPGWIGERVSRVIDPAE